MGYSHYLFPVETTDDKWTEFVDTVKRLHKSLPEDVVIRGGMGEGEPVFDGGEVCFNGDATGSEDLSYETFYIGRDSQRNEFCKTNRKPYDLFVCMVLLAAKDILEYDIRTDGDEDDWIDAIELYTKTIYGDFMNMNDLPEILPEKFDKEIIIAKLER